MWQAENNQSGCKEYISAGILPENCRILSMGSRSNHETKLHHPNTNPRQFADTRNNVDYTKVIAENTSKKKVKIFLTTEETVAYTPRSYQLNIWRRIHSQKMPRGVSDKAKHVECIGVMS